MLHRFKGESPLHHQLKGPQTSPRHQRPCHCCQDNRRTLPRVPLPLLGVGSYQKNDSRGGTATRLGTGSKSRSCDVHMVHYKYIKLPRVITAVPEQSHVSPYPLVLATAPTIAPPIMVHTHTWTVTPPSQSRTPLRDVHSQLWLTQRQRALLTSLEWMGRWREAA